MNDADFLWCFTELYSDGVGVAGKWGNCGPDCEGRMDGKALHCLYAVKYETLVRILRCYW